jgi:hypothetical protein
MDKNKCLKIKREPQAIWHLDVFGISFVISQNDPDTTRRGAMSWAPAEFGCEKFRMEFQKERQLSPSEVI